jgi:hypothetical protein
MTFRRRCVPTLYIVQYLLYVNKEKLLFFSENLKLLYGMDVSRDLGNSALQYILYLKKHLLIKIVR